MRFVKNGNSTGNYPTSKKGCDSDTTISKHFLRKYQNVENSKCIPHLCPSLSVEEMVQMRTKWSDCEWASFDSDLIIYIVCKVLLMQSRILVESLCNLLDIYLHIYLSF